MALDTDEQKKQFAEDPKAYLEHRKEMETKINTSFKNNIADHPNQKMAREASTDTGLPSKDRQALTSSAVCG